MRPYALCLLIPFLLSGCKTDPIKQQAQCEMQARNLYPTKQKQQEDSQFEDYIYACMKASGYEVYAGPDCKVISHTSLNGGCFKPAGFVDNLLFNLGT